MIAILRQFPGSIPVILYRPVTEEKQLLNQKLWLSDASDLKDQLVTLLGANNVVLQEK
nr:hypothetical protein [Secundilactobacillus oryzae]